MIVDVLRNDLGRVCRAGQRPRAAPVPARADGRRPAPRLDGDRAPRADGRDAFDLLAASFPGGSITGAPKIRAMEILEALEPVRRGPYTGALGWIGPDGAMQTSILIRTFVADGRRLTLHVGGGITWRQRPGRGVGRDRRQGARPAERDRRRWRSRDAPATARHVWVDGALLPADGPHLSVFDRGFQLGDGIFETLRARGGRPTELAEHLARLRRSAAGLDIALPGDVDAQLTRRHRRRCSPPTASTARTATRRSGSRCRAAPSAARGVLPPDEVGRAPRSRSRPGRSLPAPADHLERGLHLVASAVRRDPRNPLATLKTTSRADYVYARLEARRAGRRRRAVPDHRRPPVGGHDRQHLPGPSRRRRGR